MQQKVKYQLFLLIGISSFFLSCGKTQKEYVITGNYYYVNKLPVKVNIFTVGGLFQNYSDYNINSNDTLHLVYHDFGPPSVNPESYPSGLSADTCTLSIWDSLCYSEYHFAGDELMNIQKYSWIKHGDRDYSFYLEMDSTILNLASKCE